MIKVLFVCAENAGRSQMTEVFFNFYAKGTDFIAESSGTISSKEVNSVVVEAMKEKGIDISNSQAKQEVRKIRDEVEIRVKNLIGGLRS